MACNRVKWLDIAAPALCGARIDNQVMTASKVFQQLTALNDSFNGVSDSEIPCALLALTGA